MNCLLVAATANEISPFLEHYRKPDNLTPGNHTIDILISGIGLMATTYSLTKQLQVRKPDLVIQAGVAGGLNASFSLGSILAIEADTVADLGVVESRQLLSLSDLRLANPNQHPYKKGWLKNPSIDLMKKMRLKRVKGITVNHITTSPAMIQQYRNKFRAVTESMEGAALHYVCLSENVQFLQLRAISNYIGERNKARWKLKDSIVNLNKQLIGILELL